METWQIIVSSCAGIITLLNFLDRFGITKGVKSTADRFENQNLALKAILRNELYQCFKEHREFGAWTDNECSVQTKMHEAYTALKGNGEEKIWWDKKLEWRIVSDEEFDKIRKAKTT